MEIRRLGPGDEDVVHALATHEPHTALLADERTIFLAAFDDGSPVGFAFGYVLPRRHREPAILFVYEIGVDEEYRRQGIGKALLERLGAEGGTVEGFVLADADNEAANALYRSAGGVPNDVVEWDFRYRE